MNLVSSIVMNALPGKCARQKAIPHVRIGKYVRFNPDEVVAFFRKRDEAIEA